MYSGTTVTGLETLSLRSNDFKDCLERASQSQLRRAVATVEAEPESISRDSRLKKLNSHLKEEDAA